MSFRLAAYAVCIEDGRVPLVRQASGTWSLPGGRVEHGEDPIDAVIERLLGVNSRVIPAAERAVPGGPAHQNVGIYYRARLAGGDLRPEPNGDTVALAWTPLAEVARLGRSSLVDIGLALAETVPADGHVPPVAVGGLIRH